MARTQAWQGFIYLATVIDCYSKKVVGWSIADSLAHRTGRRRTEERGRNDPNFADRRISHRQGQCLHLDRFSGPSEAPGHALIHGQNGRVLGQQQGRIFLLGVEERTCVSHRVCHQNPGPP